MRLSARSLAWLLPLLLTACAHKTRQQPVQTLPPVVETPPKPESTHVELPPSVMTIPSVPLDTNPPEKPKPHAKRKETPKKYASPAPVPQQTSNAKPGVSAIGQLSSGDSSDLRLQTENSINAIERSLNGISQNLSGQEQKTASQIRTYLKQAREALATGDVDGAHTLAAKAKVLLAELSS